MRRPTSLRLLLAAGGLAYLAAFTGATGRSTCAIHGAAAAAGAPHGVHGAGARPHAGTGARPHASATAAGHHEAPRSSPAHDGSHPCDCIADCCCAMPVVLPAARVRLGDGAIVARAAPAPPVRVAVEYRSDLLLPFATAPPSRRVRAA